MEGYLSVSKMAKMTGISAHTLRYYDKIGLYSPDYVDEKTGYRYYSINQVSYAPMIRYLRYLDIPIDQIKRFQEDTSIENTLDILHTQQSIIRYQIDNLERMYRELNHRVSDIETSRTAEQGKVLFTHMDEKYAMHIDERIPCTQTVEGKVAEFQTMLEDYPGKSDEILFLGRIYSAYSYDDVMAGEFGEYFSTELVLDRKISFPDLRVIPSGQYAVMYVSDIRENAYKYIPQMIEQIYRAGKAPDGNLRVAFSIGYAFTAKEEKAKIMVKVK